MAIVHPNNTRVVHRCTFDEVARRFGRFQTSDQRWKLTKALSRYLKEVKALDVATAVIIDGSYVTMKAEPNDIDLVLVLRRDFESEREVAPAEYNVTSMPMVKRQYGIDLRTVAPDSPRYTDYLEFFSRVRGADLNVRTTQTRKGVLRIDL